MKKWISILAVLTLILGLLAGCTPADPASPGGSGDGSSSSGSSNDTSSSGDTGSSGSDAQNNEPIRIGYVGDLTGNTAMWGQAGLNGMLMTMDDINAAGGVLGRQIVVIAEDGRGDPQDSVNAFLRLVDEHKVVAVLGTNFSSCNIPIAPIAGEKQVPVIATAATNERVTVDENGNLHRYSFRLTFIDNFQGRMMGEYALREGWKTAAMLVDIGDSYSTGVAKHTEDTYIAGGGTIVAREEANSGDNDFRAQLARIRQAEPDVLFIPWTWSNVALIAQQAREIGFTGQFLGYDGWDSGELPALARGTLEGGRFCSRPGFSLPEAAAFGERYQARFNIPLEAECLFGHDGLRWIVQSIEKAGSADSTAIRDQLATTTEFSGLLGKMTMDPATHNPQRELAIFEIKGNDIVLIEMF